MKDTSLQDIIHAHKVARRANDERQMKYIEDSLANYPTIRDMLHNGEYVKAAGEKD